jgi:hypothetical protein
MKRINNYFILLIVVGDMGEKASETIRSFDLRKNECQFRTAANLGELKMTTPMAGTSLVFEVLCVIGGASLVFEVLCVIGGVAQK